MLQENQITEYVIICDFCKVKVARGFNRLSSVIDSAKSAGAKIEHNYDTTHTFDLVKCKCLACQEKERRQK